MKSKDLGFMTQHIEKIILAGGVLLALLIAMLYVVGNPYATSASGEQNLSPQALEKKVEDTATNVESRLSSYDNFPQIDVPPFAQEFDHRLKDSAVLAKAKLAPLAMAGLGKDVSLPITEPQPYFLPHPPLPSDVKVADSYSVFDPSNADEALQDTQITSILNMIGNHQPADFAYVSIEGKFDMDEWAKRLETQHPDFPPLHKVMWRGKQAITAIYLQREEIDPATGKWSDPIIVPSLPTQIAYKPDYKQAFNEQDARDKLQYIKENQEQIARSPFIPVSAHALQWVPPEQAEKLSPEDNRKLDSLNRRIASLEKQLTTIDQQLERQSQRRETDQANPRSPAVAHRQPVISSMQDFENFGMGGMPGRGPAASSATSVPRNPAAAATNQLQQLQERRAKIVEDLQTAKQQRDELQGVEMDAATSATQQYMAGGPGAMDNVDSFMMGMRGPMPPNAAFARTSPYNRTPYNRRDTSQQTTATKPGQNPQEISQVISVWAHDLTVQRGHTYRYRLLVSVVNPLFRENRVEQNQKAENYNKISLGPDQQELAAAPWTAPVAVAPEFNFFLVNGTAQQQVATVEVWRYFDGMPRPAEFTIQPGDPIGSSKQIDGMNIDMHVGAVLVDLVPQTTRSGVGGTTRMLYIEPGDPQILSRSMDQDRDSDARLRLQNEREKIKRLIELLGPTASAASTTVAVPQ